MHAGYMPLNGQPQKLHVDYAIARARQQHPWSSKTTAFHVYVRLLGNARYQGPKSPFKALSSGWTLVHAWDRRKTLLQQFFER
jgi:hypothetical protein